MRQETEIETEGNSPTGALPERSTGVPKSYDVKKKSKIKRNAGWKAANAQSEHEDWNQKTNFAFVRARTIRRIPAFPLFAYLAVLKRRQAETA